MNSNRLVSCITTLYLFSKIRAQLMVKHAMTMQPYLTTKCNVSIKLSSAVLNILKSFGGFFFCRPLVVGSLKFSQVENLHAPSVLFFRSQNQNDFMVICNVAKILELVVPLMDHPSETFLTTIEEDLMKLIIKYGMTVSKESGFMHKLVWA